MTPRQITFSVGGKHPAEITKTVRCSFEEFCLRLTGSPPLETGDKASAGWICGAEFNPPYRHSDNFVARHLLSMDYDHISPEDVPRILESYESTAYLAYTTWSHDTVRPRIRVWVPMSRGASSEEFQAVSRKVAARCGIELAARESHTPAQFMYRPAIKPFGDFQVWANAHGPALDVDKILGEYDDWRDRRQWPAAAGDEVLGTGAQGSPLDKPGLVGAFCRAYTISAAIEHFGLPYKAGSTEGRWTYTLGSRADGAVSYDDDTKLHSHHDTDPARGQHNAYDLVRLHKFGALDAFDGEDTPIAERPSTRAMENLALGDPLLRGWNTVPDSEFTSCLVVANERAETGAGDPAHSGPGIQEVAGATAEFPPLIAKAESKTCDLENARRLQRHYREEMISVGGTFFLWNGSHWYRDAKDSDAMRKAQTLPRIVAGEAMLAEAEAGDDEDKVKHAQRLRGWAGMCGDKSRLTNALELLRKSLNFNGANMNRAPDLLNCPNGTIDLRTGKLRGHNARDFITSCTTTAYNPDAECPRFMKFLQEIYGDPEVASFAQRWFGYCLTGDISEGRIVFHIGDGGNGKGTLIDTISRVVGESYASTAPRGLLSKPSGSIPNDVAGLMGKRMVTDRESDDREEFNEGLLKQLSGGDLITARFLHAEFFEFWPTHKLQIFTNHEPRIRGQDRGMWRRVTLLRYPYTYGDKADVEAGKALRLRDRGLPAYLVANEAQGILRWLVEGAKTWYASGLSPPATVLKATESYRAQQDLVGTFLTEKVVLDPAGIVPLSSHPEALHPSYRTWMLDNGYKPLGRNKFQAEVLRCLPKAEYGNYFIGKLPVRGFKGIRLRREGEPD